MISWVSAVSIGIALMSPPETPDSSPVRPVHVAVEHTTAGATLRVVAQSSNDVSLRYRVKVEDDRAGGNRVDQGGTAVIRAGDQPRTLATIRLTGTNLKGRLIVHIDGGAPYEEPIVALERGPR